jgi:hypothetical protein
MCVVGNIICVKCDDVKQSVRNEEIILCIINSIKPFLIVVLEKEKENLLDRSCKK